MLALPSAKDKEGTEKYAVVAYQFFTIAFFCTRTVSWFFFFFYFQGALGIFGFVSG